MNRRDVISGAATLSATGGALPAAAAAIAAAAGAHDPQFQSVRYRAGDGTDLAGLLIRGAASSPAPGVLLFGDVMGIGDHIRHQAARINALGYSVFIGDVYGGAIRFSDPAKAFETRGTLIADPSILHGRAAAAIDAFIATGAVADKKLAACGYCFGGQIALELARRNAPIVGAISFHGDLTPLVSPLPVTSISILSYTGGADPLIPRHQVDAFRDEVERAGCDWQIMVHGGVKHAFTDPASDAFNRPGVGYSAEADRMSFGMLRELLAMRLPL